MANSTEPIIYNNIKLCNYCKYNKNECYKYVHYDYRNISVVICDKFKPKENTFTIEYISIWRDKE